MKKTILRVGVVCVLCLVLIAASLTMAYFFNRNVTIQLDLSKTHQTIDGFGASAAWWSQEVGGYDNAEEYVDLLYGQAGLGLTFYRYNVGAGSKGDPQLGDWQGAESFYMRDSADYDYSDYANYDFSRDANAVHAMKLAYAANPNLKIVFFANSPHVTLTKSGKAYGAYEYSSNLPREHYEKYADYLLTVARYFMEEEGLPVVAVSPINEPQWRWGGENASQEGCHYEADEAAALAKVFLAKMDHYGLNLELEMAESGKYQNTAGYLKEMYQKNDLSAETPTFSVHAYGSDFTDRHRKKLSKRMQKSYPNIELSMTEWCHLEPIRDDGIEAMIRMARVMCQDFYYLYPISWSFWLGVSGGDYNDGLVYLGEDGKPSLSARYFAMAHFSQFINPGSVMVDVDATAWNFTANRVYTCAFINTDDALVIILVNQNKRDVDIQLGGIEGEGTLVYSHASQTLQSRSVHTQNITLARQSVNTLIIPR